MTDTFTPPTQTSNGHTPPATKTRQTTTRGTRKPADRLTLANKIRDALKDTPQPDRDRVLKVIRATVTDTTAANLAATAIALGAIDTGTWNTAVDLAFPAWP